jgi:hypothetical protein
VKRRFAGARLRMPALLAAVSLGCFVGGARAHSLIETGNIYDNGNQCVWGWTAQQHTYNSAITRSLTNEMPLFQLPSVSCSYDKPRPNGYLATRWESLKWGPNVGRWIMCGTQGFEYGGGSEHNIGRSTTGCGPGYYALVGSHYVYNGSWLGGHLVTGYEWLSW